MTNWFVDTHCHLDLIQDIQQNFQKEDSLPIKTISVTNAPSFFTHSQNLFREAKNVRIAVGLHPELVAQFHRESELFRTVLTETKYVGEIGLDGSERFRSTYRLQIEVFSSLLKLCAESNDKVITVHTRNAEAEAIQTLKNIIGKTDCRIILHWFSGSVNALRDAINAGFYISVNHQMTKTKKGQDLIRRIPMGQFLTETDAPFTLDAKMTRLESLYLCIHKSASILNIEPERLKTEIYDNFRQLLF